MFEHYIHTETKSLHEAIKHATPLWAKELTHHYVRDLMKNTLVDAREIISDDLKAALDLRASLKSDNPSDWRYRCRECEERLTLACSQKQDGFHFRHLYPNPKCSIIDGKILPGSVLRAIKFNGKQESRAHAELKWHLLYLIQLDTRFENARIEEWQRDEKTGEKRRPDILADFEGQTVAFEIQISTESIRTIKKRQTFYKTKGWVLAWIFQEYNFHSPRVSDLDIVNTTNWNALVLNEEALDASTATGRLHLKCVYLEDNIISDAIETKAKSIITDFSELKLDIKNNRIYYFDREKHKSECRKILRELTQSASKSRWDRESLAHREVLKNYHRIQNGYGIDQLDNYKPKPQTRIIDKEIARSTFLTRWDREDKEYSDRYKVCQLIKEIYDIDQSHNSNLVPQLRVLLSAKRGYPVGWNYQKNLQVFHLIFDNYKNLLFIFLCALEIYGNNSFKTDEKVISRKKQMWKDLTSKTYRSKYSPDRSIEKIAQLVFPEFFTFYWQEGSKLHLFEDSPFM